MLPLLVLVLKGESMGVSLNHSNSDTTTIASPIKGSAVPDDRAIATVLIEEMC